MNVREMQKTTHKSSNNGIRLDTYLNNNSENRSVSSFKKKVLIGLGLIVTSFTAIADQVIFSQYDGVNTWNNVYIEVDSAIEYVKPGVGFVNADPGSEGGFTAATAGVKGVLGYAEINTTNARNTVTWKKSYTQQTNGSWDMTRTKTKNGITSVVQSKTYSNTDAAKQQFANTLNHVATSGREGISGDVFFNDEVSAVEGQAAVQSSWEQSLPARAILAVDPRDDLTQVVAQFMNKKF